VQACLGVAAPRQGSNKAPFVLAGRAKHEVCIANEMYSSDMTLLCPPWLRCLVVCFAAVRDKVSALVTVAQSSQQQVASGAL
jgi:hypothetical protein